MMDLILPCYLINADLIDLTARAIESFGEVHRIIIDNGSIIGGGFLRSQAHVYIRNNQNIGYAKAVNQGLKLCTEGYIAIANNDVRVSPNWQQVAEKVLEESNTYSCHFRMTDYDTPFKYGEETFNTGKERWCTSSFFVIKNLSSLLYDERYLNSYDDWDYWMRVRNKGFHTAYTNRACYQHHHSSTQILVPDREIQNQKNREYFKSKWGSYPEDLFSKEFPDQMMLDYTRGFDL